MSVPVAKLSCEQCQRRKTKCDKTVPCSACVKTGIVCTAVQRHRLPRGKSGKVKTTATTRQALRERVGHLETLFLQLQSQQAQPPQDTNIRDRSARRNSDSNTTPVQSFIAPEFWADLSSAVSGLKDVLERRNDADGTAGASEEDLADSSDNLFSTPGSKKSTKSSHWILFANGSSRRTGPDISQNLKNWLLDVYKERVDCLFKPLHWPSALRAIQSTDHDEEDSIRARSLEYAIYFTSVCSLFDHELDGRPGLAAQLRYECENALREASLLTTRSLIVLQAFVVYLAGIRACQANAQQWTLTALAVRIANALDIPANLGNSDGAIDTEVRRRLWHCVAVLDLQSTFDRGSQPLLRSKDLQTWPEDMNDSELQRESVSKVERDPELRWTDMSLSLITYHAGFCQRRLTEIGFAAAAGDINTDRLAAGREQLAILAEFEGRIKRLSEFCGNTPSQVQKFAIAVGEESAVAMRLLIHRPLHRRGNGYISVDPNFNILETATEVLERSQMKRSQPEFAPWAWFQWVKWYALAIVLAELCGNPQSPLTDRAWSAAQLSYDDYAKDVADTKRGLLWKPIARLMQKAKRSQSAVRRPAQPGTDTAEHTASYPSRSVMQESVATEGFVAPDGAMISIDNGSTLQDDIDPFTGLLTSTDNIPWFHWDQMIRDFSEPCLLGK